VSTDSRGGLDAGKCMPELNMQPCHSRSLAFLPRGRCRYSPSTGLPIAKSHFPSDFRPLDVVVPDIRVSSDHWFQSGCEICLPWSIDFF
jgi:hypothetical protein